MNKYILILLPILFFACKSNENKKIISTIYEPAFYEINIDTSKHEIYLKGVESNDTLDSLRFYLTIPSLEELKSNQLTFLGKMPYSKGRATIKMEDIDSVILVVKNLKEISPRFTKFFPLENKLGIHKIDKNKATDLLSYFTSNYVNFTLWIEVGVTNGSIESKNGMETKLGFYSLNNQIPTNLKKKEDLKIFNYTHLVEVE